MMLKKIAILLACTAVLSGCASNSLNSARTDIDASKDSAKEREATIIHFVEGNCKGGDSAANAATTAPAVAAVIGLAVDTGVNIISQSLERAKSARNAAWTATGTGQLTDNNNCLVISRGFIKNEGDASFENAIRALPDKFGFAGYPAFVAYIDIEKLDAKRTFKFTPYKLIYGATAATRGKDNPKDLAMTIAFSSERIQKDTDTPDTKDIKSAIRLDFGRLSAGKSYDAELLKTISSAMQVQEVGIQNIAAIVMESEDKDVALEAFSAAFDDNKDDLSKALKDAISEAIK